ncbi:hypothetical protein V8F33_004019 [Rhypophila sp. PSN 637]
MSRMDFEDSNTKVPTIHLSPDRQADASESGTQARNQGPPPIIIHNIIETGKQSSHRHDVDSSDYTDDDSDYRRDGLARQRSRSYSIPNHRGRLDAPIHPGEPLDRDSGYYGSTSISAYPSYYPGDDYHPPGYPGYAGQGQMIAAAYTAPSQNPPPHLTHYHAPAHRTHYRDDRPAITARDGTEMVRKPKHPGAEDKANATGISSLNDIDAVWNISSSRDVTLHLELDVEDDVDANLEEFSAFARRGDYKRAEKYYQDNLSRHSGQPKVIIEYVRMLVEKGSYKSILDLGIDEDHVADIARSSRAPHVSEAVQLLLLLHMARIRTDADINATSYAATIASEYLGMLVEDENQYPLNHAQIQVLSLYVDMLQTINSQSQIGLRRILSHSLEFAVSDRLKSTYEKLLVQGNFWDIRDLIISSISRLRLKAALSEIFPGTSTEDALFRLLADWRTAETNELSDLSLLDILNAIAADRYRSRIIRPFATGEGENTWQTASNLARAVACSIRDSNPALMKSRSYLEWLLNEEQRDRLNPQDTRSNLLTAKAFKSFPGKALDLTDTFVYVPRNVENPGWPVSYPNRSNDESKTSQLILVALKVARELGNYNIEARCLHELVCRAEKPDKYLAELEDIFTSVNGDRLGLLKTRLMRYLTVANSDDTTRQKLKSQLVELDPRLQSVWRNFSDTVWEWAYRRVLFALMASLGQGDTEQATVMDQQGQALAVRLPLWAKMDDGVNNPYPEAIARERREVGLHRPRSHTARNYSAAHRGPLIPLSPSPSPPPTEAPPHPNNSLYDFESPVVNRNSLERQRRQHSVIEERRELPQNRRESIHEYRERERSLERSLERERPARRKSARFDEPETRSSHSIERQRPKSKSTVPKEALEKAVQDLEEERRKQNEVIKKRAEEELRLAEREEEVRRRAQEEMARMYEEKRRLAEAIKMEQEQLRHDIEKEIREKLEMEAKARAERMAMEEQMRARATAEIRAQLRAEEEAKAAARAREVVLIQQAKEEAKRELELKRLAKKEAIAAKRLAKAAIYSEAEANAKRMLLAELKARVPGKRLRAMLGIPEGDSSDADGRLIEEVGHSDSGSSAGPHVRLRRRYSSSSSDTESLGDRRARRAGRGKHYRRNPRQGRSRVSSDTEGKENRRKSREDNGVLSDGLSFEGPVLPDGASSSKEEEEEDIEASIKLMKGKEKEMVQEEKVETDVDSVQKDEPQAKTEPTTAAGQAIQSASSPLPTPPRAPDPPVAKARDSNKKVKVADESEEEAEEHRVTTDVQEKQHNSDDNESLSDKPADEIDMDDIYD